MLMTSPFDLAKISDEDLEKLINKAQENLSILFELKRHRGGVVHVPVSIKYVKGSKKRIARITCSCKHITEYRVPLTDIMEFECPKDKKGKHGEIQQLQRYPD